MMPDFDQWTWNESVADDCRQIVRLAVREDIDRLYDWTTTLLVPATTRGAARFVARRAGVVAGLHAVALAVDEMQLDASFEPLVEDGQAVTPQQVIGRIQGSARDLLTSERILLNLLGRLCGIATLTRQYVDRIQGTAARLYDTRKTTPGWRRLEKYAVHCGGGHNHRTGLFDAVLIKDNHLAVGQPTAGPRRFTPAEAVLQVRRLIQANQLTRPSYAMPNPMRPPTPVPIDLSGPDYARQAAHGHLLPVEIEVDTWEQFQEVLPHCPDIILLDNMTPEMLRDACQQRDRQGDEHPEWQRVELEASGGITLDTIRSVADSGVDRISCGALTHSAVNFDIGLDWDQ
jgi:nicotinate-nucleotide pyrophosphorylase (carboxylating)